jgi:hypothetical protein
VLTDLRLIKFVSLVIIVIFVITSCVPPSPKQILSPLPSPEQPLTEEEKEKAKQTCILKYTAGGVITGALIGLLIERKIEGAIKGGLVGGTLAFAIAWGACLKYYSNVKSYSLADARETARKIKYDPSQGVVTKIETFNVAPNPVSPGDKVQMNAMYYVMTPDKNKEIKVVETRTVYYYDENGISGTKGWIELGSVDYEVTAEPGTRKAEGDFELPERVPEGKYKITLKISADGVSHEAFQELIVKKGVAKAPTREPFKVAQVEQTEAKAVEQTEAKAVEQTEGPGVKAIEKQAKEKKQLIKVISRSLNVRESPSLKSRIVGVIKQDETYEVIETKTVEKQKWIKIKLEDGTEGWVLSKYVKLLE